ncbi:MAG: T9SS type B sorting domain-containing protein [Chitinophagales bacterium]|nr:T9SS type B sorting domain-containing protein [Chitinophagales bacterium]
MNKAFLTILFSFILCSLTGQINLVPGINGPVSCPVSLGEYQLTPPWDVPSNHSGTPDYMHACNSGIAGTPSNGNGIQNPYNGPAYYGIITYGGDLREYMQVQLSSKLKKGYLYEVGVYVSLADNYKYASNHLGIHISKSAISGNGNSLPISSAVPQIYGSNIITNASGWTLISGTYHAQGDEEFITIGNFNDDAQTQNTTVNAGSNFEFAYYFFDNPYIVSIGEVLFVKDDTICRGDTATLIASGSSTYAWAEVNNPSVIIDNDSVLSASPLSTNQYYLYGSQDTIIVTVSVDLSPVVELGDDREICEEEIILLNAYYLDATYLWNDGSSEPSLVVKTDGIYSVDVSKGSCTVSDEIEVSTVVIPDPNLPSEILVCDDERFVVDLSGISNVTYQWPDGSSLPTYSISSSGPFWVQLSENSCSKLFSSSIEFEEAPVINLPADTAVCNKEFIKLGLGNVDYDCVWSNGSSQCYTTINEDGVYTVSASNRCGTNTATIAVDFESCRCFTVIPNSFSPNGDGVNESFAPLSNCEMSDFIFKVFHRSGKLVFVTDRLGTAWDGRFNLNGMPAGSYVYTVEYKYNGSRDEPTILSGSFNLVR